jgi:Domain of unknown function (DUF5666)
MKRLLGTLAVALLAVAVPAHAQDKAKGTADKAKTMTAVGAVTAVTGNSVTVKGKDGEWTFDVDSKTQFTGKGFSTKTAKLKEEGKSPTATDFIKAGDQVTVKYHDMGSSKHAASVALNVASPK